MQELPQNHHVVRERVTRPLWLVQGPAKKSVPNFRFARIRKKKARGLEITPIKNISRKESIEA